MTMKSRNYKANITKTPECNIHIFIRTSIQGCKKILLLSHTSIVEFHKLSSLMDKSRTSTMKCSEESALGNVLHLPTPSLHHQERFNVNSIIYQYDLCIPSSTSEHL
mmetsp:Transcript_5373/g.7108  ORF Transcript_5373/g.7108 Transcript_5373/m.7108 type:complete len:107 (-) Transcript_5373:117-437(-)